jgi:hypothetical protein
MVVQKMHAVVQKMQVKPSFSSERYVLNNRPMGDRTLAEQRIQIQGKQPWKGALYAMESWD